MDAKFARDAWLRALAKTAAIGEQGMTLPALIERLALEFDAAPALLSTEASMTFRQLGNRCNQYSRWGLAQDLKGGDSVALLMTNCAEYVAIWLGLTRIGVVVALINSQLAGDVLAHYVARVATRLDQEHARPASTKRAASVAPPAPEPTMT